MKRSSTSNTQRGGRPAATVTGFAAGQATQVKSSSEWGCGWLPDQYKVAHLNKIVYFLQSKRSMISPVACAQLRAAASLHVATHAQREPLNELLQRANQPREQPTTTRPDSTLQPKYELV